MKEIVISLLLVSGTLFIFIAAIGILRMPDLFMRLACTSKSANLGLVLLLVSFAWYFARLDIATRALATVLFLLLTTPVAAHRIARVAYLDGIQLWEGTFLDELRGQYDEERNLASLPEDNEEAS
jgi:multicomponent Na+:H+ antiporter subunit G